jgi:hypothetical protein
MRLVKVGGAVYTQNPCNGLAGHGLAVKEVAIRNHFYSIHGIK